MFILSISENILLFVLGAGVLQAFFLAGLLYFHPRSDRSSSCFLALFILALSVPMLMPLVQYFFSWQAMHLVDPFTMLIGPFLYLYVRNFKELITWRKVYPHFLLFFLYFIVDSWTYIVASNKYPLAKQLPQDAPQNLIFVLLVGARIIQLIAYYFLSRKELNSYQRSIQHLFSETSRISLAWVRWLINGFIILVIPLIFGYLLSLEYPKLVNWIILINAAMITPYIYIATIKGIVQPTLWQVQPGIDKKKIEERMHEAGRIEFSNVNEKTEPRKTRPGDEKIEQLSSRIIFEIEQYKLYQEPELTLQNLADKINFPSYQVSRAINEGMRKTFYDLINEYRVEEAKRLLLDAKSKNYTILSVGFEAGFNSKTTFNTVFKKFTGFTPTEFRNVKSLDVAMS